MNIAARATQRRFLWFLHADSRLTEAGLAALVAALARDPGALCYFDLAFETRGMRRMALNNAGAWVRSHWLGMPFGDQGFCLGRERFLALGGFDESAPYGEDHLLVWSARRAGMPIKCTDRPLLTSPRKYAARGWLATTWDHLRLTAKQAWPEALKTLAARPRARSPHLAVAVFVKTPGLSPIKTRLAAGIGAEPAATLYQLSVRAVESVLRDVVARGGASAYWAVAERDGHGAWTSFATVGQGDGDLGARLATVYESLTQATGAARAAAVLIGADAPQVKGWHFEAARSRLADGYDFVIGPATDGGFYLLAGSRAVPRGLFERVPYSVSNTAEVLARELSSLGRVAWLTPLTDVDTAADLEALGETLGQTADLTPEQARLARWLDTDGRVRPTVASS